MANNDILSEFDAANIKHFSRDFVQLIKVGLEIDRHYSSSQHNMDSSIPKFENLLGEFNKKYKGIKLKSKKSIEHFKVRLFIEEKSIKDFFANSASKIQGLKSVGKSSFSQIAVSDTEKFAGFLDSLFDKIYISYSDNDGAGTIAAAFNINEKMIELMYSPLEIINENSAGFKICAYYALKEDYDRNIDIYPDALTFGFTNVLKDSERKEWLDRFNPRFLE